MSILFSLLNLPHRHPHLPTSSIRKNTELQYVLKFVCVRERGRRGGEKKGEKERFESYVTYFYFKMWDNEIRHISLLKHKCQPN